MGFYSRWGSIISLYALDWGCIRNLNGWGCNQEWGSNRANTVCIFQNEFNKKNLPYMFIQHYTFIKLSKIFSPILLFGAQVYLEHQIWLTRSGFDIRYDLYQQKYIFEKLDIAISWWSSFFLWLKDRQAHITSDFW